MKIYTKTGDKGTTALFGGTRVSKHDIRIESYGTLDELNSHIGLLRDQEIDLNSKKQLITIQEKLFVIGAILATDPERAILKNGKERLATALYQEVPFEDNALKYLNRLSDYLFVMARFLSNQLQAKEIKWIPEK